MLKKLISGLVVVSLILLLPAGITFNTGTDPIAVAQTTVQATAVAEVEGVLKLIGVIKEIPSSVETTPETDLWSFTTVTNLNFGTLEEVPDPDNPDRLLYMTGQNWYAVFLLPVTSGLPYEITETAGPLIGTGSDNAGEVIDKAFILVPDYQSEDKWKASDDEGQGSIAGTGDTVGNAASAVGSNPVFSSVTGKARIIRAYLAIGGPDKTTGKIASCIEGHNGVTCNTEGTDYATNGWEAVLTEQKPGPYSNVEEPVTFTLNLKT